MRVIVNPAAGYLAIPFLVLAGGVYLWIASRLVGRKTVRHEEPSVIRKVA
ncbi:MAG TPA: hypothetical protein VET65_09385 [Candidatus Limnocylindrales bacterium]|nr:hypothetical protein [Candidatus Limnocylindrales bacterium]